MGKVKIKKKETRIDMTAMSDVTVLLLTFFMLTSTFLQKEPTTVITPPSVSEEKVPDERVVSVIVSPEGRVFMNMAGTRDTAVLATEKMREDVLEEAVKLYNKRFGTDIAFTPTEYDTFKKLGAFGVPMADMKKWLNMSTEERDEFVKTQGIPINDNMNEQKLNEFQIWIRAIYHVMKEHDMKKDIEGGKGIAVKADQSTPYHVVQLVMSNLQTMKMNKFSLMTALKVEED